jgi:rhodanese-related sulfurtransferase
VGYLADGIHSVESRPDLTVDTERLSAPLASERLEHAGSDGPATLDVRTPRERREKRIPGGIGIPLSQLSERLSELPVDRPLIVYCAGGYRSSIAASLLQREGFKQISEITGGITAWETANLPTESGAAS